MNDPLILLFKLGSKKDMIALLERGHVHMKTLGEFKRLEDRTPRWDPDEATHSCLQMSVDIQLDDGWQAVPVDGGIRTHDTELESANVYCLHARTASQCSEPWSLAGLGYGDYYVLFRNPVEFISRLRSATEAQGHTISYSRVEYVDRYQYHGPMGAFRKFSERSGDSEFRVLVSPGVGASLDLYLGSLADIAVLGPAAGTISLDSEAAKRGITSLTFGRSRTDA